MKKNEKKNRPAVRAELGAVGRCVTDGATRLHTHNEIFYQYKDRKYTLRTLENFYIEFLSKPSRT